MSQSEEDSSRHGLWTSEIASDTDVGTSSARAPTFRANYMKWFVFAGAGLGCLVLIGLSVANLLLSRSRAADDASRGSSSDVELQSFSLRSGSLPTSHQHAPSSGSAATPTGHLCASVEHSCTSGFVANAPCQCDVDCVEHGSCCSDFHSHCTIYKPGTFVLDERLLEPSSAPLNTFYAYRAQSDKTYPPENTNLASLGGVLWYIHNELINHCFSDRAANMNMKGDFGFRKFKVSRILRYKVQVRAPEPLFKLGMNFGPRVAFDRGKNTGAWDLAKDSQQYYKFGYNVGCNVLGEGPYPLCPSQQGELEHFCPISYPDAYWYSFPGECPNQAIGSKTDICKREQPGGACKGIPTGQGNCTYSWEDAGWIDIDELDGIKEKYGSHYKFCEKGCKEYRKYGPHWDEGKCIHWWDGRADYNRNVERMKLVDEAFQAKYPEMAMEHQFMLPACDFNKERFYNSF